MSEYPDREERGNGLAIGGGLHPSKTPSVVPNAHSLADILQATPEQLRDWQHQLYRKSESWHLPMLTGPLVEQCSSTAVG